jgi:hypothetical protein
MGQSRSSDVGINLGRIKVTFGLSSSEQYRLSEVLRAIMETLCPKLLDAVLAHLAVGDYPCSARFAVPDDASRRAVLTARQVTRCFRDSKTLEDLFVAVLEETLFRWYDYQMPRLLRVSWSRYGSRISTLSLCGMSCLH